MGTFKGQTERLVLRSIVPEDLENVYKGLSHPDVIKYYGVNYSTLESTKEQMQWFQDLEKNETGIWLAICSKKDLAFLGATGLNNLIKIHRKAELGFWLFPEFWNKGIISEAVPVLLDYAFNDLKLHRIEAVVETGNFPSAKVLKKLGFKHEGRMVDCEIKNGKFISHDFFALLNSEEL